MRRQKFVLAGATLLAASLAMSACGTRTETPGTGEGSEAAKVAKIGVIAPLSGDLSALGLGIQNSVDLAVKQANEAGTIPGWTLEVDAQDDQAKPDVGKNAATKLAGDDAVIGVVGTLNSSVSQSVQPVLSSANIVQVSPANTNPTLTQGPDPANPTRAYPGYFRTCTTDAVQGPFAAKYLLESGIKTVATIHDKKAYGQGLVAAFSEAFKSGGGTISAAETINPDDKNFSAVISKVKSGNPQAVYYGGEYPQAGPLSQQMKSGGVNIPLMGGDGIYDPAFIELAGKSSDGDLATSVGAPTESLASAKQFVDRLRGGRLRGSVRGVRGLLLRRGQRDHQRAEGVPGQRGGRQVRPAGHHRGHGLGQVRRGDRPGGVRPVRRHHHQDLDGLQGRGRQVGR